MEQQNRVSDGLDEHARLNRLAAIVEASDDAIFAKSLEGTVTSWNRGAAKMFGFAADEIVGSSILRLVPRDRHDEERDILRRIGTGESVMRLETVRVTKDGQLLDVAVSASPIRDAAGTIVAVSTVARDITARRRAEAALRESEARYRSLFSNAPDGIVIADKTGLYVDANPAFAAMLGYAQEELVGRSAADVVVPEEVPRLPPAIEATLAGADYRADWQLMRKDGSRFSADVIGRALPDGNLLIMVRDVTERNRIARELRTAGEWVTFVLENADIGVWDMDYTTGVVRWSQTLERHYGLTPGSFGGTFEAFTERVHPEDREGLVANIAAATASGGEFTTEHRAVWPDGTVRRMTGAGRIIKDEQGQRTRAVGISMDVTARHTLEQQYLQAQKMEAVGRLAGGIAHDFNNLLTAILGYCELALDELRPEDPLWTDITEIQHAGTTAAGLTRQLLAFSRKQIIQPALFDLNDLVSEMRGMIDRIIGEDVAVTVRTAAESVAVLADRAQMEQVLLNLIVNARDAMPSGGRLRIETRRVELDEHYAGTHLNVSPGVYSALVVTDSGTGMPPEVLAHLFEPFFTTKEQGKGTGLGLATVHGIVTRAGGYVSVYSEVGRGTSFTIYLPRVETSAGARDAARGPSHLPSRHRTVLLVEDASGLRTLTQRLLERSGYTVLAAANADEALTLAARHADIDVVLTDVVMPGASGPDLGRRLLSERPDVKIVYMSGYTQDVIVEHGMLRPGIAFLHKPFTSQALARKLRDVLGE